MLHTLPDGVALYYEVQGTADAERTIVFLNGLSQSTLAWAGITPPFNAYKILLLDLVFQGQSGAASDFRSYDAHAADLLHLLDALKIERPIICGISYGSAMAQHFAVNYPDRVEKLILLSTFAHNTAIFNAVGESWRSALLAGGYTLMLDVMLPTVLGENYFERPLIPIESLKDLRTKNNLSAENLLQLMRATETRGDYRPQLHRISAPTLVVQGENDLLIPPKIAQQVADHIPGAQFAVVPKVGHTLNLEAIPQTIQLIRSFIES